MPRPRSPRRSNLDSHDEFAPGPGGCRHAQAAAPATQLFGRPAGARADLSTPPGPNARPRCAVPVSNLLDRRLPGGRVSLPEEAVCRGKPALPQSGSLRFPVGRLSEGETLRTGGDSRKRRAPIDPTGERLGDPTPRFAWFKRNPTGFGVEEARCPTGLRRVNVVVQPAQAGDSACPR